jgi:transposase
VNGQRFWDGRDTGSIAARLTKQPKTLRLWVRRKRGNRKLECSGCGRKISEIAEVYEREVRDLPWSEYRTTVVIELYRVRCPLRDQSRESSAVAEQGTLQQAL